MTATRSNPFLAAFQAAAPTGPRAITDAPAAPTTPPADPPADGDEPEGDEPEAEEEEETPAAPETPAEPADPAAPAEPSASAPAPHRPMSAFDRTALRVLGKGDLVARIERAEADNARLIAENTRIANELLQLREETPRQVEAAASGRKNEVSRAVAAELQTLGIDPAAAPSAVGADEAEKTKSRDEFEALSHEDRNAFMRTGGRIVG